MDLDSGVQLLRLELWINSFQQLNNPLHAHELCEIYIYIYLYRRWDTRLNTTAVSYVRMLWDAPHVLTRSSLRSSVLCNMLSSFGQRLE